MRPRTSLSMTSANEPLGYQYRNRGASSSGINAVHVNPMLNPTLSPLSIQIARSFRRIAPVEAVVPVVTHSRVTGERLTFTRRTVEIHLPSVGQRPSCDQRWLICTRLVATLCCLR